MPNRQVVLLVLVVLLVDGIIEESNSEGVTEEAQLLGGGSDCIKKKPKNEYAKGNCDVWKAYDICVKSIGHEADEYAYIMKKHPKEDNCPDPTTPAPTTPSTTAITTDANKEKTTEEFTTGGGQLPGKGRKNGPIDEPYGGRNNTAMAGMRMLGDTAAVVGLPFTLGLMNI